MDLIPHIRISTEATVDADPRIDPRIMWPLDYLRINYGFTVTDSVETHLHGDILRAELERGDLRVTVTWIPATDQRFLTQAHGTRLLGTYDSFATLAAALEELAEDSERVPRAA